MKTASIAVALCCVLGSGCPEQMEPVAPRAFEEFRGDEGARREAVASWAARGEEAIPVLKTGLEDDSAKVRAGCREALARITGQWGWDEGLIWKRSMTEAREEAERSGKPIMLLQLFGKFDEEFC